MSFGSELKKKGPNGLQGSGWPRPHSPFAQRCTVDNGLNRKTVDADNVASVFGFDQARSIANGLRGCSTLV